MRILLLARYLPAEGSTTHMYTLARELIARGHRVAIGSAGHDGSEAAIKIFNDALSDGIQHLKMPFPLMPNYNGLGKLRQALIYLLGSPISMFLIARWKPDVIHVHYPVTSFLATFYRHFTKVKFLMTYHISGVPKHPLHQKGDMAVAISSELQKEIISKFGYEKNTVHLVHNGIELDRFTTLDESRKSSIFKQIGLESVENKIIVGFIGTISARKGVDILLDAFRSLDKNKFHLVLVGDGDTAWLRELISNNQLHQNVSIFPFSKPEDFYSIFDVFVLPSRKEGFPLVIPEAMASGILTIRSNVEGATDQITDGVTGFLFDNEDSARLSELLQALPNGTYKTSDIANAGREKAIKAFGVKQMVDKTEKIYHELTRRINT